MSRALVDGSRPPGDGSTPGHARPEVQPLLRALGRFYVEREEDKVLLSLLDDMVDRTLAEREGRTVILTAPSGGGKTTIVESVTARHLELSRYPNDGTTRGMLWVQVPSECTLADLGTEIARAAGYPVKDGLKASAAWGAAMRRLADKDIRFLWLDELSNLTDVVNVREARKVRTRIKMSMINRRHTMGLLLTGDPTILDFLLADPHIARRSDVLEIAPVTKRMFKIIERSVVRLAAKAGMTTAPDLATEIVPRLAHASLLQFGTTIETTRATIMRAVRRGAVPSGAPRTLTRDDFAHSWARAHRVAADDNPFVAPHWATLDCAEIMRRGRAERAGVGLLPEKGKSRGGAR